MALRSNLKFVLEPKNVTHNKIKATFYIEKDLLNKIKNFAHWDRLLITEAFDTILKDGLKSKNTKPKP